MNKLLLLTAAALAGLASGPAFADATGTVNVTGTVGAKCAISGPTSQNLEVNELSQANGTVVPNFDNAGSKQVSFSVICTSGNPTLKLSATALTYSAAFVAPGYTHVVHYTSTLTANAASGTDPAALTYTTADVLPGQVSEPVGGPLKNALNNLTVAISNSHTTTATDLLAASPTDGYVGTITVVVSPT
ncbi:MAG: hypothetical protein ACHP7N_02420 [Caulobacterales bacterium]